MSDQSTVGILKKKAPEGAIRFAEAVAPFTTGHMAGAVARFAFGDSTQVRSGSRPVEAAKAATMTSAGCDSSALESRSLKVGQ